MGILGSPESSRGERESPEKCAHKMRSPSTEVVDLRWGVTDAVGAEHGTTELCLSEVARCTARSSGVAFVFLSGER